MLLFQFDFAGCRSLTRDLEAQVALVTANSGLKAMLHEVCNSLDLNGTVHDEVLFLFLIV